MTLPRTRKWLLGLGLFLGLVALLWIAVARLLPSDEALAQRAAAELEQALGVKVSVGALHWQLRPVPALVLENIASLQPQPIVIKKLTAQLNLAALLQRRVKVDSAELEGAVLPQLSLPALGGKPGAVQGPYRLGVEEVPLARLVFRDVSWITRYGVAIVFAGEVDFDAGWRPRQAQLRRPDFAPATDLSLTRQAQEDRWAVRINLGGGTAHGELQLQTRDQGRLQLGGKLQPRGIEVASALSAFNRTPVISGKASGSTTLSASGQTVIQLAQSVHTQTTFTMGRSALLRFDLDKAMRSAGQERAGKTPLDAVSGQLDTQNTAKGMVVNLTDVKAKSGTLSVSGQAKLAQRQVDAEFAVDLVDGVVGVPLRLSGPINHVKVSVPPGALAGAAVGTAVLPGVGTAIGARVGATLGKIFSPEPAQKSSAASKKQP
ncbi:glycine zipper domain-containing protein [Polaromonas sp.]|uniref:glycine zipper domain-containing protein n=1 Tax=Polaromonas sp. TaxID=1869339 RepID=UPI0025D397FA|nr:glycine zipper domain-containing protein [Polaromonas sp.]